MAAKAALLRIIAKCALDEDQLVAEALASARFARMSVASVLKIRDDLHGPHPPEAAASVEAAVRDLVRCAMLDRSSISPDSPAAKQGAVCVGEGPDGEDVFVQPGTTDTSLSVVDLDFSMDLDSVTDTPPAPNSDIIISTGRDCCDTQNVDVATQTVPRPSSSCDASTQATLLPTAEDFSRLVASFKKLHAAFSEFLVASADREVQYVRKISHLSKQVEELQTGLQEARQEVKLTEQHLSSKVQGLSTRLGDLSASFKASNQRNPPAPSAEDKQHPRQQPATREQYHQSGEHQQASSERQGPGEDHSFNSGQQTTAPPQPTEGFAKRTSSDASRAVQQGTHRSAESVNLAAAVSPPPRCSDCPSQQSTVYDRLDPAPAEAESQWITVPASSHRAHGRVDGSHKPPKALTGAAPRKRAVFFVGGISLDSTSADLIEYCRRRGVQVSSCRMFPSKRFGTQAARLSVAAADADRQGLLSDDFWPEHVVIRPWYFPGSSSS